MSYELLGDTGRCFATLSASAILLLAAAWWLLSPYRQWKARRRQKSGENVSGFLTTENGDTIESTVRRIFDPPKVSLSLVLPAYNEEDRLLKCLTDTCSYMECRASGDPLFTYELIVCDDGSTDNTMGIFHEIRKSCKARIVFLGLSNNYGKGEAIRMGFAASRGKYILMLDADGATKISDIERLESALTCDRLSTGKGTPLQIVFGSRSHLMSDAVAERSSFRNCLMYGFHMFVRCVIGTDIQDTQCGFKLFSREAARLIVESLHLSRWAFDIEIVVIAQSLGLRILEVAVNWREVEGSKLNVISASIGMARDILMTRILYALGIWTVMS